MLGLGSSLISDANYKFLFIDDYSISFDGSDDYIECDDIAEHDSIRALPDNGSISAWIKVATQSSSGTVMRLEVNTSNYISLYYHASSNELRTAYRGGGSTVVSASSAAIENDGQWHHAVTTWSTTTNKIILYLDGSLVEAKPNSGSLPTFVDADIVRAHIGQNTNGGAYFKGLINDVSLWNGVISGSDIQDYLYRNGKPSDVREHAPLLPSSRLMAYYKFEEGDGTDVLDSSKNSFDGTITNGAAYATDTPTNPF